MARRILLLITDLEIGGTPTVVRELAIRLNRTGRAHVEVACLSTWGPVADQLRDAGVTVTYFDASGSRDLLRTVSKLRTLVRDHQIDTVFSFLVHANVVAALASRKLNDVRFLQSMQTIQRKPKWHWWAHRWSHQYAERMVVPSTAIVRDGARLSRIPPEKFEVIPNAVDFDAFPRMTVFRRKRIRAGYLGRLDPAKNPGLLLDAIKCAAPEIKLHYFGDGPERANLERAAAVMGDRVLFHGTVASPQEALAQIDVLWQPSSIEGFGLIVIEAMASGIPVVSTGSGGVLDIIEEGKNGLFVDAQSFAKQFADATEQLKTDVELRERIIANGLRTVREKFTWDIVLPQYLRLLKID